MDKILIIGGQGFIGRHLGNLYKSQNYKVITTTKYHKEKDKFCIQSDYSRNSFLEILKNNDYRRIFFLSGNPYPGLSIDNCNIDVGQTLTPLINVVEALKLLSFKGDFWFASSVAVYGDTKMETQSETDICNPLSNYAVIKLAGENFLKMMSKVHSLNLGSLRIFSTFGENLKRQLIFDIYKKVKEHPDRIALYGSGEEIRDLSYVGDQVRRIKIVSDNIKPSGDIYNIGSGEATKVNSVAEEIVKIMGLKTVINYTSEKRVFDGYSWVANMEKFEKLAPNPKLPLSDSLIKTINSLESLK